MKYAVLDIEASGGKKGEEKIIDLAIYQYDGEQITDQFGSMVNPERNIDSYVQKLTGITDKMVKRAPKFYELAKRVVEITQDCIIVGHGVDFDYRMLQQEFSSLGFDFQRDTIDTLRLSKMLFPEQSCYSLGKLCKSLGIPVSDRHRAQGDTLATLSLFKLLLEKDSSKNIVESYAQQDFHNKERVQKLLHLQANLPEKVGVYYFYDEKGKIFYLNAAKNIAIEVNNNFTSRKKIYKDLQEKVHKVSFETTGNFFIALLKLYQEQQLHKKACKTFPLSYGLYILKDEKKIEKLVILKLTSTKKAPLQLFLNKSRALTEKKQLEKEFSIDSQDTMKERRRKIKSIKNAITSKEEGFAIIGKGRSAQEKSFIEVDKEKIKGYGFFNYHQQFEDESVREKLLVPVKYSPYTAAILNTILREKNFEKLITLK